MELEEALILLRGGSAGIAEWNRRRSTGEAIPQLEKVDLRKADLRDAFLEKANLTEAILTNADLRGVNIEQADLTKAHLEGARLDSDKSRIVNLKGTILREANLNRADLDGSFMLGADLHKANLERASLEKTNLTEAILTGADFRGATLNGAILSRAKVAQANFRDADLQDADLREMEGFYTDQLAGASVSGAKLPDEIKSFAALSVIEKACADARTIFWGMLLGCFYTVLTIATTTDARLITNSSSSPLPIIGTQIPIAGFYVVAPLILFGFYLYFHLCMQNIWERLGTLPAILPDGRELHKAADPWLLLGLVQSHFTRLRKERTFLSHIQAALSWLLAWGAVPLTLLIVWLRYLRAHDWLWSAEHILILIASCGVSVYMYRRAVSALTHARQRPFSFSSARHFIYSQRSVIIAASLVFCSFITHVSVQGFIFNADVQNADVSTKPDGWTGDRSKEKSDLLQIKPASLTGANLRGIRAAGAFLARADLRRADLRDADLRRADLRRADLSDADLRGADLTTANIAMADLGRTIITEKQVSGACLDNETKLPEIKGFVRDKYRPSTTCVTLWGLPQ